MEMFFKKESNKINHRASLIVVMVITLLLLSGCNDNSDQIVHETNPVGHFDADDLMKELSTQNPMLKESVVVVEGVVEDINFLNNRITIILKGKETSKALVICDMQKNQLTTLEELELGQKVKIKGILKGSLKDIILLNCIITN